MQTLDRRALREHMRNMDMVQWVIAAVFGVRPRDLKRAFNGKDQVSDAVATKIADTLGVTLEDITL